MRSKISKQPAKRPSPKKAEHVCSESELSSFARIVSKTIQKGDRVLLEGDLGAGKSTLARHCLEALGVVQDSAGSPSFPIAHVYESPHGSIIHVDFYRLEHEAEVQEAGLEEILWESGQIVFTEWFSKFPSLRNQLIKTGPGSVYEIQIEMVDNTSKRNYRFRKLT